MRFTLGTGAGGTVISASIVKAHNLLKAAGAKVPNAGKPQVGGVDGLVFETTTARIDALKLEIWWSIIPWRHSQRTPMVLSPCKTWG
ncbi:MAG TPA: hypothetical protein VH350_11965 [Candidatus Sulfotelmatobacter sp.]|nr:hypothetical protein [Candidatus Sulfotelmatobacter sp.]